MENKILELENLFSSGDFELKQGEDIRKILKEKNVPNEYGIYIIYNDKNEIIYIGKAGTVNNDGSFKKQGLRKRLKMKQNGMYRHIFFQKIIKENNYKFLKFKWFVTYKNEGIYPFLAEAELLSRYLDIYKKLPLLNKTV
jgi:excinuclease UvrABC nuclease subunit